MKEVPPLAGLPVRESVVRGTLIVAASTLLVRGMSFLYRPVTNRMFAPFDGNGGTLGSGLVAAPGQAYLIALAFTSIGFNVAIARLVAERVSLGDRAGARQVFRISLAAMTALGALAALLFWLGAPWLERATRMPGTAYGYIAMAPALVLISMTAAFRGLFQGFRFMQPNALSGVLEAGARIVAGLAVIWLLVPHSVVVAAGASNLGDAAGGVVALAYLGGLYWRHREALWPTGAACDAAPPAFWTTVRSLLRLAAPISLIGAAPPLISYADSLFLGRSLGADPTALVGQLGFCSMIIWLPAVFTAALSTSLVPSIAEAMAHGNSERVRHLTATAYRATLLLAWPATAGLWLLAIPVYRLVVGDNVGAEFMPILALATLPVMVQQIASSVLQGAGRATPAMLGFLAGAGLKVLLMFLLVPRFGGFGAAWATVGGFMLAAGLNLYSSARCFGLWPDWLAAVGKPLSATALMSLVVWGAGRLLPPHPVTTVALAGLGALVYGGALLLVRGVTPADIERVPRVGPRLASKLGSH